MTAPERPWLTALTYLGFQINGWLEDGNHGLTFDDVYEGLDNDTLWEIVNRKIPEMDLSMFTGFPENGNKHGKTVLVALRDAASGIRGRERRKYGVEAGGLSLLMAFVLEAIQQESWTHPKTRKSREE